MFSQYESKYGFVTTNGPELNNVKNETEILRDGRKSAGFNTIKPIIHYSLNARKQCIWNMLPAS